MAIQAPKWCDNAIPSTRGWHTPEGELLVSRRHTEDEVNEWSGIPTSPKDAVETTVKPKAELLTEAPIGNVSLTSMTKLQLEALGAEHGLELDRRQKKSDLIDQLEEVLS